MYKQYPPFLPGIVLWMEFDRAQYECKELQEEIFAQVACHISLTFTRPNNSRLSFAPTSASSFCLSHALCVDSEGNLLENIIDKASQAESVYKTVHDGGLGWTWTVFPLFGRAVYLETVWKARCVSQMHSRPGTRWSNIHLLYSVFFSVEWHWDNEAACSVRGNLERLSKMFNPVHSQITIAGLMQLII